METYYILQNYWWLIMSVLGALLVFMLFVQGGQSMLFFHRDEAERSLLVNSLGRKWELTFTTLVTFGGAFFASFPLFYSTSFGGAYWLWMLILLSFVIQAVSYEYRAKQGNVYGRNFYDVLLLINGIAGPILLGVAVATMFFGAEFTVTKSNILNVEASAISNWGPLHGLEAIVHWRNLLFGVMVYFLATSLASLYFINNINDDAVRQRINATCSSQCGPICGLLPDCRGCFSRQRRRSRCRRAMHSGSTTNTFTNYLDMWWALLILLAGVDLCSRACARR